MLIHVELCDHCGKAASPGVALEAYKLSDSPRTFHICSTCQEKPFKRVVETHPNAEAVRRTVNLLLGRGA